MQTLLFVSGVSLFLAGLLTGLAIPVLKNPRMGLSSHVEAHMNGLFLVVLGLLWPHVDLPEPWDGIAVGLLVFGAVINWVVTLLAAAWGAGGRMMPIAAPDRIGSNAKEGLIKALLVALSLADIVGVALVLWGVVRA